MVVSMIVMIGAIFIPFFSTSLEMFLIGGIIQGLPWVSAILFELYA